MCTPSWVGGLVGGVADVTKFQKFFHQKSMAEFSKLSEWLFPSTYLTINHRGMLNTTCDSFFFFIFFPGWLQLGYAFRSSSFDNKVLSILEKGLGKNSAR